MWEEGRKERVIGRKRSRDGGRKKRRKERFTGRKRNEGKKERKDIRKNLLEEEMRRTEGRRGERGKGCKGTLESIYPHHSLAARGQSLGTVDSSNTTLGDKLCRFQ